MEGKHTGGTWKEGENGHCIVSSEPIKNAPSGANDKGSVEYYGGHLICESVSPCNIPILKAAPKMLLALEMAEWVERCGQDAFCPLCGCLEPDGHSDTCRLKAAINAAKGES